MDALPSSFSNKIFARKCRNGASDSSSRASTPPGPAISFVRSSKFYCGFSVTGKSSVLYQFKPARSASHSPLTEEKEEDAQNADSQIQDKCETKMVHVKFKLQKACLLGQQFLLVGEDPIFGLWEPLNAIPLDWSEGHVWTTELEVPVGKKFQFKFLLKGDNEEIGWQPGPNRVLQTWETKNTIVITEDWENAELQQINEEESSTEVTEPTEEPIANLRVKPIIAENDVGTDGTTVTTEKPTSLNIKGQLISYEGDPVLVPGLAPTAPANLAIEEVVSSNVTNGNVSTDPSFLIPGLAPAPPTKSATEEAVPAKVTNDNVSVYSSAFLPGLVPEASIKSATEEVFPGEVASDVTADASVADEPNDPKTAKLNQLAEKKEPDTLLGALPDTKLHPEEKLLDGFEETDSNIGYKETSSNDRLDEKSTSMEEPKTMQPQVVSTNDIQWGCKILLKFFLNLFSQEST